MQANNDPKWTDDAGFWEEAWADMNQRLTAEDDAKRKGAVAWWRRPSTLLASLALLLAITAPTVVSHYFPVEAANSPTVHPAEPTKEKATAAEPPVAASSTTEINELAEKPGIDPKTISNAPAVSAQKQPAGIAENSPVQFIRQKKNLPALAPTSGQTEIQPVAETQPDDVPREIKHAPENIPSRENTQATALLPISALSALAHPAASPLSPVARLPKLQRPVSFGLELGVPLGPPDAPTGLYAGVFAEIPLGKRFSLPLSVRYRRDYFRARSYPSSNQDQATNFPVTGAPTTSDTIYLAFNANSLQHISTSGVEGRLGLAYRPGPRWQLSSSLSATRLFAAKSSFTQAYLSETAGAGFDLAADISLTENFSSYRLSSAQNNNYVTTSGDAAPVFRQWMLRVELGLTFQLTPKLQLAASAGQLLQQPDLNKILGVQRGRVEFGAKWQLR